MSDPTSVAKNLTDSICRHCKHRVTRVVIPHDYADYGITLDERDVYNSSSIVIEHHICLELDVDLDCDVLECSRYKDKDKRTIRPSLFGGDLLS